MEKSGSLVTLDQCDLQDTMEKVDSHGRRSGTSGTTRGDRGPTVPIGPRRSQGLEQCTVLTHWQASDAHGNQYIAIQQTRFYLEGRFRW